MDEHPSEIEAAIDSAIARMAIRFLIGVGVILTTQAGITIWWASEQTSVGRQNSIEINENRANSATNSALLSQIKNIERNSDSIQRINSLILDQRSSLSSIQAQVGGLTESMREVKATLNRLALRMEP